MGKEINIIFLSRYAIGSKNWVKGSEPPFNL
jgi:hypothetical protein